MEECWVKKNDVESRIRDDVSGMFQEETIGHITHQAKSLFMDGFVNRSSLPQIDFEN